MPNKKNKVTEEDFKYIGEELAITEYAINWKEYFAKQLGNYITGDVLEVGAGLGGTTKSLYNNASKIKSWICLEPDEKLGGIIKSKITAGEFPDNCSTISGFIEEIPVEQKFDTIIYIDVIEHIEDDKKELVKAKSYLKKGGHLVILVPAFQFLFNEFDTAIGHYRRYDRTILRNAIPENMDCLKLKYLDSVGFFASVTNKLFLHQSYPTKKQIQFWDTYLIPISRIVDALLSPFFGKSLIGVWKKKID